MYINKGLSIICEVLSKSKSLDPLKQEYSILLCPYAGKKGLDLGSKAIDLLIAGTQLFHDESMSTGKPLIGLFGEWLGNKEFRKKCLSDKELILKGSGVLETFPHECVEIPALQLIYDNVEWYSDVPEEVEIISRQTASRNVANYLNKLYISS